MTTESTKICLKCLEPIVSEEHKYGLHSDCFIAWFKVSSEHEFVSIKQHSVTSQEPGKKPKENQFNTSFFHGMFKKYSADLESSSFILKMRQSDAPEIPEVEYVCNQIGHALGLPVAEHYLINFMGEQTFVTRNFIKKGGASSNLDHIYKYVKEDQAYSCEVLIEIIKEQTKRPYHVETFIQTILYDSLIANHDRHGRNLGFIVMSSASVLSPIYDNVSYLGLFAGEWLKADLNQPGKVAVLGVENPSMTEYVLEFRRLGYDEVVREFYSKIKPPKVIDLIEKSFCSDLMKQALIKMFKKRYKELEDALN
ncbi:MAG TPA: HipA domain-containing protein [Pseudobdellovibrionaceae bacterium]|jgi:hypothetical protein